MVINGRTFEFTLGSDVQRAGRYLELIEVRSDRRDVLADVVYSDVDGFMTLTQYDENVPPVVLIWLKAHAQLRLPPGSDAV